jgi:hypothetical protein
MMMAHQQQQMWGMPMPGYPPFVPPFPPSPFFPYFPPANAQAPFPATASTSAQPSAQVSAREGGATPPLDGQGTPDRERDEASAVHVKVAVAKPVP